MVPILTSKEAVTALRNHYSGKPNLIPSITIQPLAASFFHKVSVTAHLK